MHRQLTASCCEPISTSSQFDGCNLSVIIPVCDGSAHLHKCLSGLERAREQEFGGVEVIVVADNCADDSAEVARRLGAQVIETGPVGPAIARNLGAAVAQGEILVFLDADVEVHADTLVRIQRMLQENENVHAVFGAYDAFPSEVNLISQFRNLFHHHTHRVSRGVASTFWTGCGGIRRNVFQAMDGFAKDYSRPSIEDIQLGLRLNRAGYCVVKDENIQVTHHKRWTLSKMIMTDVLQRAIPWTRLMWKHGKLADDLNLRASQRIAAGAAVVLCLVIMLSTFSSGLVAVWALATVLCVLASDFRMASVST